MLGIWIRCKMMKQKRHIEDKDQQGPLQAYYRHYDYCGRIGKGDGSGPGSGRGVVGHRPFHRSEGAGQGCGECSEMGYDFSDSGRKGSCSIDGKSRG